ncbi:MAG: hypothetical protein KAS04_03595 [Candidatus Aenigmarchaeota archaeon]|nr:hypothetical protein [Candidatus Aenigmarchaeota archaeon]
MPAPISYLPQQIDPLQRALQGLRIGSTIQGIRAGREKTEQARIARQNAEEIKKQYSIDIKETFANPTPSAFAQLTLKYPQQREAFKQSAKMMTEGEIVGTKKVYNALLEKRPDVALEVVEERITAVENSGGDTTSLKRIKESIQNDPEGATATLGYSLSSIMEPGDFEKTYIQKQEEQYRVLTTQEKGKLGLDISKAFQMGQKGKISQIGGKGVSVTIEGKPQFGKIPPGWQMTEKDGSWFMEPIPGGPAEVKAKVLAKKKQKQKTLEKRAGNVVLEDIGRFKEKINDAPWYSPVLGVSGYLASFVPATNRVDAENLQQTIVANIGFDRLQQMREASPTGGALGAISERELSTLQSVLGNLSLSQSEKQLTENIDRLNTIYSGIVKKANAYPNAQEFGFKEEAPAPSVERKVVKVKF